MRRYQVFSRTSCTAVFLLTSLLALSVTRAGARQCCQERDFTGGQRRP